MSVSVGIDLGTTYCAVSIIDKTTGRPVIVQNTLGENITPSAIYFKDGLYYAGVDAKEYYEQGDPNCAVFFKRDMGNENPCFIAEEGTPYERAYTAVELSACLLDHLKKQAESKLSEAIEDAVITCPAYYHAFERECVMLAASYAGIKVRAIIEEPCAAALAYGVNNWHAKEKILVYDLGGGTFDATLVEMDDKGVLTPRGTKGKKYLGGKDWDDELYGLITQKIAAKLSIDSASISDEDAAIIRGETEKYKKKLSTAIKFSANFYVDEKKVEIEITREEFEKATSNLLNETGELCDELLTGINIDKSEISDVLLVGGSTRMPQIKEYLTRKFGKSPITHISPDTAVACGAAIQTLIPVGVSDENAPNQSMVQSNFDGIGLCRGLKRKTTHAMGIILTESDYSRYYNEIIIPANTSIPTKFAKKSEFVTQKGVENRVEIYVIEGDKERVLDNEVQYKYVAIPRHNKSGEAILRIQYEYDSNGIITVRVRQDDDNYDLPIEKHPKPDDLGWTDDVPTKSQGFGLVNQSVARKYKPITFSNVKWEKYDNIPVHADGSIFNEPSVHVIANEKSIEFHGYNVSAMDEGVYYRIDAKDDFEIECNIDTSNIREHPENGGIIVELGIITARLNQAGGNMLLNNLPIATVGARFKLKMSFTNGEHYEIYVNGALEGEDNMPGRATVDVRFGMMHDSHGCSMLQHAYISNIDMKQSSSQDADMTVDTWD